MRGVIRKKHDKGFGFITPEDGSKDVFFHASSLRDVRFNDLREGDELEFETEQTDRGLSAVHVELVQE